MTSRTAIQERIASLAPWFHNLRLNGVQTAPKHFLGDYPQIKWERFREALPADMSGKTVLDIGCNAGFYSIEMKRRGAKRVVGIDSDERYLQQARFAAEISGVEVDFHRMAVWEIAALKEKFDLVIFMGVLYHLRHPLLALDLIHEHVARDRMLFQSMQRGSPELLVVEEDYPFSEERVFEEPGFPKMHFIENCYCDDQTNWWVPNRSCVEAMLRSSGFLIEDHPEDEVYLCRWQPLPEGAEGPHSVYPLEANGQLRRVTVNDFPRLSAEEALLQAEDLLAERSLPEAIVRFDQAQEAGADVDRCAAGRWECFMLEGRFSDAWCESDAIRKRGNADPHRFWNGEPLKGKRVMLRCLHGYGDAIQFLRYVPLIREEAAELTIEVSPAFAPLARHITGVERVVTWDTEAAQVLAWDLQVEVIELPYLFRSTLNALPVTVPYLDVPRPLIGKAAKIMSSSNSLRVGVAWCGGDWNPARSLPLEALSPLLDIKETSLWSLQGGSNSAALRAAAKRVGMQDVEACGTGLLALAAAIANLDLVVSVDTMAAHMAGAMGKPVCLLLQHAADWRWMIARQDSPWYPTMRLFRQTQPGDWTGVVHDVQRWLVDWIRESAE
ncbi:MAG TPA: TIGR04290 family methyltransferase [Acidobacteriaceae bacterium]